MKRLIAWMLFVGLLFPMGCGDKKDPDAGMSGVASQGATTSPTHSPPPNEIVAMFADSIRRGDRESTIKLITAAARDEIQRRGLTIDPPGSPEASYKIGDVRFLDDDKDAAYVESLWIEPGVEGQPGIETEVVWAVQLEPQGWRISGLAIDMGKDQPPTLVDFENLEGALVQDNPAAPEATGTTAMTPPASTPAPQTGGPTGTAATPMGAAAATPPATTGVANANSDFTLPPGNALPPPSATPPGQPAGFTMPDIQAPRISQPPNTQLR